MTYAQVQAAVVAYLLQDATNPDYYGATRVDAAIDAAWLRVTALVRFLHPSFLTKTDSTSMIFSSATPTIALPTDFISLEDAWIKNGNIRTPCDVIPKARRFEDAGVYLAGAKMGMAPVPVTSSTTVEFDYQYRPKLPSATPTGLLDIPEEFHQWLVLKTAIELGGAELVDPASGQALTELLKAETESLAATFDRRADEQDRVALSIFWE